MNVDKEAPTCPEITGREGETGEIKGCGSTNVRFDQADKVWDCLDCGIWFEGRNL